MKILKNNMKKGERERGKNTDNKKRKEFQQQGKKYKTWMET